MNEHANDNKNQIQISSPEQLHDYLHVTSPTIWIVLVAIILLLVFSLIWSSRAAIDSYADVTATVNKGTMVLRLADPESKDTFQSGMKVIVGETTETISSVGHDPKGAVYAVAKTSLADGDYRAKVLLKQTVLLSLLFN